MRSKKRIIDDSCLAATDKLILEAVIDIRDLLVDMKKEDNEWNKETK